MSTHLIARNTTYFTAAIIFQKLLATLYFIFIARHFSNADVGEYTNAIYLATLFGILLNLIWRSSHTRGSKVSHRAQEILPM